MRAFILFYILLLFTAVTVCGQVKDSLQGTIRIKKKVVTLRATIAGKSGGKITPIELCSNPVLLNDSLQVTGFTIALSAKGTLFEGTFKDNYINGDYRKLINYLKNGSKVIVKDIIAGEKNHDKVNVIIPSLTFILDKSSEANSKIKGTDSIYARDLITE